MVSGDLKTPPTGWVAAAGMVARWLDRRERVDEVMAGVPPGLAPTERARCQNLVFGVIRHAGRLEAALDRIVAHPPRFPTRAILYLAGYELIEASAGVPDPGRAARIVHHAVEQAKARTSPAEARLVNAVGRKLAAALVAAAPSAEAPPEALAEHFSHPVWLVRRWLSEFGPAATRALLQWNQQPAPVYARWRSALPAPPFLQPTPWPGFFEVPSGHWAEVEALLATGSIYIQDPATRLPVDLLNPQPGEAILDACAAPGGKSLLIADRIAAGGEASRLAAGGSGPDGPGLVALDLPGERIDRLRENLARAGAVGVTIVAGDVRRGGRAQTDPAPHPAERAGRQVDRVRLPDTFTGVLLDVPCTNTGVMRHRVDVKWRLQEGDFAQHARQQLDLLVAGSRWVAPGGRLVYSTCSIDREENQGVVDAFLRDAGAAFQLKAKVLSYPWETGHDGGAAFLLVRSS
jgi:16S rRNA (cytosine967-C5)-methyltransferase